MAIGGDGRTIVVDLALLNRLKNAVATAGALVRIIRRSTRFTLVAGSGGTVARLAPLGLNDVVPAPNVYDLAHLDRLAPALGGCARERVFLIKAARFVGRPVRLTVVPARAGSQVKVAVAVGVLTYDRDRWEVHIGVHVLLQVAAKVVRILGALAVVERTGPAIGVIPVIAGLPDGAIVVLEAGGPTSRADGSAVTRCAGLERGGVQEVPVAVAREGVTTIRSYVHADIPALGGLRDDLRLQSQGDVLTVDARDHVWHAGTAARIAGWSIAHDTGIPVFGTTFAGTEDVVDREVDVVGRAVKATGRDVVHTTSAGDRGNGIAW